MSVLNTFSKIYKIVFKDQIVNALESVLLFYAAAYKQLYKTQQVLLRLLKQWKQILKTATLQSMVF